MHSLPSRSRASLDAAHLRRIFHHTLSQGSDMDGRGLHWRLSSAVGAEQRLAFALAVYFSGGLSILIDSARGFLCVDRIALAWRQLQQARAAGAGAYRTGKAFAALHEALGYSASDRAGFQLIAPADVGCVEGFISGFGARMAQSLEADILRIVGGAAVADEGTQLVLLRHFIDDRLTANAVPEPLL